MRKTQTALERFESKVYYALDGCWYWTGYLNTRGYGVVRVGRKTALAHRFSYSIHKGEIPNGLFACHRCDNPSCINPDHIFLGTNQDNMNDMKLKGRSQDNLGHKNPKAKLNEEQVIKIRSISHMLSPKSLAEMFDVSRACIYDVLKRKRWNHI